MQTEEVVLPAGRAKIPNEHQTEVPAGTSETNRPTYRGKTIAIVMPAYNEESLIGDALAGIPAFVSRIYVVNDCSTDRTQEILEQLPADNSSIVPIRHEVNRGVGAAIVTGYKRALEDRMDIVAVMAGDNQMDPTFLPDLLDPIVDELSDYTMGNRLVNPDYRRGMSTWRFAGNSILTLLTKIASGYWKMVDPQNGYTAISFRALSRLNLDDVYPRYGYCNDLLIKLNVNGFRVTNVPHPARYGREQSGIRYSPYILSVSRLLVRGFLWRLKMKYLIQTFHPLVVFYLMGAVLITIGILGGIYTLFNRVVAAQPLFVPLGMSLIIFSIGVAMLLFAMVFDIQEERESHEWYG